MKDKVIILPNGTKVKTEEFLNALMECIYNSKEQIKYKLEKTSMKARKAAFVSALAVTMTTSLLSQEKEMNAKKEEIASNIEDDYELKAGVALHMSDDKITPMDAGVSLYMPQKIDLNNIKDVDIKEEQTDSNISYDSVFVGYDLENVEEDRKEITREYQKMLYEKCRKYDVPFNVMMVIFDNESGSCFNTNGAINKNSNGTVDYGLFQINSVNFADIEKDLEITPDELLNNPEKNMEAACYFVRKIIDRYGQKHIDEMKNDIYTYIFGVYNGGGNYKNISRAVNYANNADIKMKEKYNKTIDELTEIKYNDKEDENVKSR